MRKVATLATTLVAAGTGWISLGLPAYVLAEDKAEVRVETADPNRPRIDSAVDQANARRLLAQATKAALGPNSLQNVSDLLVSNDRDRIRNGNVDTTQLDNTATQVRDAWKAKYNSDFTIDNPEVTLDYSKDNVASKDRPGIPEIGANSGPLNATAGVENRAGARRDPITVTDSTLRRPEPEARAGGGGAKAETEVRTETDTTVREGEVTAKAQGPAAQGQQRISDAPRTDGADMDAAQPAGARVESRTTETRTTTDMGVAAPKVDADAQRTSYWIPASHGLPAAFMTMTSQDGALKVNLNDSVDANRLAANLNEQLTAILNKKDQWPTDSAEAQRVFAHHIAFALSDHLGPAPAAEPAR